MAGVDRFIVAEFGHYLPPGESTWPAFLFGGPHRYRQDGSLEIDIDNGTWRDQRTGESDGVYSRLVKLLGSQRGARVDC
ncbi:MAG: hypothetical protein OXC01_18085 [Immundisolibacterales bacterium]|nr:hypothetical protein [Immundisolibacterales bacterium]